MASGRDELERLFGTSDLKRILGSSRDVKRHVGSRADLVNNISFPDDSGIEYELVDDESEE